MKKKKSVKKAVKETAEEKKKNFPTVKVVLGIVVILLIVSAVYLLLNKPQIAKQGDTVLVEYTGSWNNTIFDTNVVSTAKAAGLYNEQRNYQPLEVQLGGGRTIKGFEDALYNMKEGETKTFDIPPALAYGEYDNKKIASFNLSEIQTDVAIEVGTVLTDGRGGAFRVIDVSDGKAYIDLNHPLAGKTLTFEIKLLEIKDD